MKIAIYEDELYPVYYFEKLEDNECSMVNIDIPEETLSRYEKVIQEWEDVQKELWELFVKKTSVIGRIEFNETI